MGFWELCLPFEPTVEVKMRTMTFHFSTLCIPLGILKPAGERRWGMLYFLWT